MSSAFPATQLHGLGAIALPSEVLIFFKQIGEKSLLHTASSQNGTEIHTHKDHPRILDELGNEIPADVLLEFRISKTASEFLLVYKKKVADSTEIHSATSKDATTFKSTGKLNVSQLGIVVPNFTYNGKHVLYWGEKDIHVAYSSDGITWESESTPVLSQFQDQFGVMPLKVGTILPTQSGLLLIFYAMGREGSGMHHSLHAAFFDLQNPSQLLRRSETLWEQTEEWSGTSVTPVGVVYFDKRLISYWDFHEEGLFAIAHTSLKHHTVATTLRATDLQRLTQNPLLTPVSAHYWESKAVFNPAAVVEDGKVHLLYRAVGDSDMSVLGYASSINGVDFEERLDQPAYIPRADFEGGFHVKSKPSSGYSSPYQSGGGGYGGCEDPRLTRIDDRFYLTYVAYDGGSPPRVALSSISVEDFLNKVWKWKEPVLISPPGVVDKNAVVFPEKVNGKYVVLHRIFPNILVDFVDDLDAFDGSTFLKGEYAIRPTRTGWDNRKVGAGAPPIKTKDGWLLIYHSVGEADPGKYKMGAMLLDLQDPTKVLYRTVSPILAPDENAENEGWKSGVAYPCGAVILNDLLYVYYGGADTVVCAATANIDEFLKELKSTGKVSLTPVSVHTRHQLHPQQT